MTASFLKKNLLLIALTTALIAQGPLDPPAGAPAPGMKTLDQIESRTPISSLPFTIDTAGSYYLTGNLTSAGSGITITASKVTLDLNGFNLKGFGTSSNQDGIKGQGTTGSPLVNLVIKNGTITNFGNSIELSGVNDSTVKNVHCSGSGGNGIYLTTSSGNCNGNSISQCHVSNSGYYGISLSGASGQCNGNSVSHCNVSNSGNTGIHLTSGNGQCRSNSITHCLVSHCASTGIGLTGSLGKANGNVIAYNTVHNITDEVFAHGILISNANENRIEGNHVTKVSNTNSLVDSYGIRSSRSGAPMLGSTPGNLIFNNSSFGADENFKFDPNDTYGPVFTISGEISSTNPWANFSR